MTREENPPEPAARRWLEAIFITSSAGRAMQRSGEITAIAGIGLEDDRYALGTGYYSRRDECQVTVIEGEALERMQAIYGVSVGQGEHRRNLVTRGIRLCELAGQRMEIGAVVLEYVRPRPPCHYMGRITVPQMTRALGEGAGICMNVIRGGLLRQGMEITIVGIPGARPQPILP